MNAPPDPSSTSMTTTTPEPVSPMALFGNPDFRRLWVSGALAGTTRWLDTLVAAVIVYRMSESALMVALIMFLRTLPMLLLGLFSGALLDRLDRQYVIFACLCMLTASCATLAVLNATGHLQIWHVGVAAFLAGVYWTTEHPGRRALIGEIAGPGRIGPAMGFDSSTINLTRLVGPPLGGVVLETAGFTGAQVFAMFAYGVAALQMAQVRYRRPAGGTGAAATSILAQILEGFRYVVRDRRIMAVLLGTIAMNLFAFPYSSMIVPIGQTRLLAGPIEIGLLNAAEATGAFIGSLCLAFFGRAAWYMRLFLGGSLLLLTGVLCFGLSTNYFLSIGVLFIGGFGFAGFGTMQTTIIMMQAPAEIRSRIMGTLTVCIGAGPIGVLISGFLAQTYGPAATVVILSGCGVAAILLQIAVMPDVMRRPATSIDP